MKYFFHLLVLFLVFFNTLNTFWATFLQLSTFSIKTNWWPAISWDIEVNPWNKLSILISWDNKWTFTTNVSNKFTFSSNQITYLNPGAISSYKNWILESSNIPTSSFNPPTINSALLSTGSILWDILDLYYLDLKVNQNTTDTSMVIWSQLVSDLYAWSNLINRTIYINSRPHIIDYYFEKAWVVVNQLKTGWSDSVDLTVKVKDYNGCINIDNANITANLSSLGLTSSEALSFVSCNSNIAIYKKSQITTLSAIKGNSFTFSDFSAIDEDWHTMLPNDPNTLFDNEDKKTSLFLDVVSPWTPIVNINTNIDTYIWWANNLTTNITLTWSQNWQLKIIKWSDSTCVAWNILRDWTPYIWSTLTWITINSSVLVEWNNVVTACLKNNIDLKQWSNNINITKDTIAPTINSLIVSPVNIVTENSSIWLSCSEDGIYNVELWWTWILNSGTFISSWSILWNTVQNIIVNNASLWVWVNNLNIFCSDNASNYISNSSIIIKTTPPPSFVWNVLSFADNDIDMDWLDWRDVNVSWNNALELSYTYFESIRLYLLPSNITLNTNTQNYIKLITNKNQTSFTGSSNLLNDSVWNSLISWWNYKVCISIMWTNWKIGTTWCSANAILTADNALHANIISSKFTTNTNLEITTDVALDTILSSHSWWLISYNYNGITYSGWIVSWVNNKIINITIPALNNISATATSLTFLTWAIRAKTWWFNNFVLWLTISDGQAPVISNFLKTTAPIFWNFYNSTLNFTFNFLEDMKVSSTKLELSRASWNIDSTIYSINLTWPELLSWSKIKNIDLNTLNLISWTNYKVKIIWTDLASNFTQTPSIQNIIYDNNPPDKVVLNNIWLISNNTPTLTWNTGIDDFWNGSWIKNYNLSVYNWLNCSWVINQQYSTTLTSQLLTTLPNIADYSWNVYAVDNMSNTWAISNCDTFRVDTSVPSFSNSTIKDTTLNNINYLKAGDNISISSTITNTNSGKIWIDLSTISWNPLDNNLLCSNPWIGKSCSYVWTTMTYTLVATWTLIDWVKQVKITSQNTSGWNQQNTIFSTTADSNAPIIISWSITSPTWIIWWLNNDIIWSNITDTIWVKNISLEYSLWLTGALNIIWTWANNWLMPWNTSPLTSGNYNLKITAFDNAWNFSSDTSTWFEIDNTLPAITANTLIYPNWWEIFSWSTNINILWNTWTISDKNIVANPISLEYSLDNGVNWISIAKNIANNWSFTWNIPNINSGTALVKIMVKDIVNNKAEDISNANFIIDSTAPTLSWNYTNTPASSSYINNSWFDITANTSDNYLSKVFYSFNNSTASTYWNWTSYTWAQVWNQICNDTVIKWTSSTCNNLGFNITPTVIDSNLYNITLKSIDEAWNITISPALNYIWDTINPNTTIWTSSWVYFSNTLTLTWTSSDTWSQVSNVGIQIQNWANYWNWSSFVAGIQTLNTTTTNLYSSWSYNFTPNWIDSTYNIKVISYDSSYKTNNTSNKTITIIRDTTSPVITWWINLFISPIASDIFVWWTTTNIRWNTWSISDTDSWLASLPIKLEYFNWTTWNLISNNLANNGQFLWNIPFIDSTNAIIRLSATDKVWNTSTQNSPSFIIDSTPPSIVSVETMDMDTDWKIDALNIIMSENILDNSIILSDFNISWIWVPTSLTTWAANNDNVFILHFNNTWNTSFTPTLSYIKWTLTDRAWKFLANKTIISIDKSSPRILSAKILDNNSNWKLDQIVVTFSEQISNTSNISAWIINNISNWMSISWVSVNLDKATINLNEWTQFDTSPWNMSLNFTSNLNWKDLSNNTAWNISNLTIIDWANPIIVSSEYLDTNNNSKADKVNIVFSENITGYINTDLSFSWFTKNSSSLINNTITALLTETLLDNDTWIIASLSMTWIIKDISNNSFSPILNRSISDKISPKLMSINNLDTNWNWKIDKVQLTYSENINSNFIWFIGEIDWYILNTNPYSIFWNNTIEINAIEKPNYTTLTTPNTRINSNSSITDISWNLVLPFTFQLSIDKVWPVITWARFDELNNKVFLTFSENINPADFIVANFVLQNAWTYSVVWVNTVENSITITWATINYSTSKVSFKWNSVRDALWNKQLNTYFSKISPPIVINEIMVSNNSLNNYIELRNLSNSPVNIGSWTVAWVTIPNLTTIPSLWYYLISKWSITSSIINISPDLISNILTLTWASIALNNWVIDIDTASLTTWFWNTIIPKSIERKSIPGNWALSSNWYTAQTSTWFVTNTPFGTPKSTNILDQISPTISSSYPNNDNLLPTWSFDMSFDYLDNTWWLWVNTNSDSIKLYKWNWVNAWWTDLSATNINLPWKTITTIQSNYRVNNLTFWKYKAVFSISDNAWNIVNKIIIFYIDSFEFLISSNNINIWTLTNNINNFSTNEVIVTIKTVWVPFKLNLNKSWNLTSWVNNIFSWNWIRWFWYNLFSTWYSWNLTAIWNPSQLANTTKNLNINWLKNIYTYKIKYWANINITQAAWLYTNTTSFNVITSY